MLSKFQIFKIGFFDVAPHLLSVIPFGIIFGAIGIELGFDPIMTYATSLIIFGGASQIVFLQLLSGGASSLIAITSVGVINSRHLLYGAVLSEYLNKLPLIKKLFISYFIVDQGFAVSNIYFKNNKEQNRTVSCVKLPVVPRRRNKKHVPTSECSSTAESTTGKGFATFVVVFCFCASRHDYVLRQKIGSTISRDTE